MLFVDCGVLLSECTVSKSCVVKIQVLGCSRLLASHVACSHAVKGGGLVRLAGLCSDWECNFWCACERCN